MKGEIVFLLNLQMTSLKKMFWIAQDFEQGVINMHFYFFQRAVRVDLPLDQMRIRQMER